MISPADALALQSKHNNGVQLGVSRGLSAGLVKPNITVGCRTQGFGTGMLHLRNPLR